MTTINFIAEENEDSYEKPSRIPTKLSNRYFTTELSSQICKLVQK